MKLFYKEKFINLYSSMQINIKQANFCGNTVDIYNICFLLIYYYVYIECIKAKQYALSDKLTVILFVSYE